MASPEAPPEAEACVLGATGYVGGELLRLLAGHPHLRLAVATSRSQAGRPLSEVFPHLGPWGRAPCFQDPTRLGDVLRSGAGRLAVFGCAGHGESAELLGDFLGQARSAGRAVALVDLSADFRHRAASTYRAIYGHDHGAPEWLPAFSCALPDLTAGTPGTLLAHPGCFTTAVTLGAAPFLAAGRCRPFVIADAITGSTGSGRTPSETTHHPERQSSVRAYKVLDHRHRPEMESLLEAVAGVPVEVAFVPHSGPFARGIHATLHLELVQPATAAELVAIAREFYAESPFLDVSESPPPLKSIVGTNRAALGVAVRGRRLVVTSVIDNLTKGAAGGALHWMNRLLGYPATAGLDLPAVPWI